MHDTGTADLRSGSDLHLTRLFEWAVRTLGRALLLAMVGPLVVLAVAAVTQVTALVWLAAILGPPLFAWQLMTARAPVPTASEPGAPASVAK
ncbi:MAG: hypothetical protein ACXVXO_12055 [Mycobacteriaceae bacterium]